MNLQSCWLSWLIREVQVDYEMKRWGGGTLMRYKIKSAPLHVLNSNPFLGLLYFNYCYTDSEPVSPTYTPFIF